MTEPEGETPYRACVLTPAACLLGAEQTVSARPPMCSLNHSDMPLTQSSDTVAPEREGVVGKPSQHQMLPTAKARTRGASASFLHCLGESVRTRGQFPETTGELEVSVNITLLG